MIEFSPKQKQVWRNTIQRRHRWNISLGATRSGKTYLDYYKLPHRIRRAPKDGLILLLGNTKSTLQRNILNPMRDIWSPGLVGNIGSDNKVNLFGRECYALGADKINQVSKLQGAGLAYCYGDEITTWHPEVFQMLKSRLDKPVACFDGTCNPEGPNHWFKHFLDSDADIYQMPFTIDDNPFLPPNFVSALKQEYAGTVYYNRFILGQWTAAEGIIYRLFAANPKRFLWPPNRPLKIQRLHIGVDFGGNGSAHAFVATGVLPGYSGVVALASRRISAKGTDESYLSKAFLDFVATVFSAWGEIHAVYCDSAEQVLKNSLQSAVKQTRFSWLAGRVYNSKKICINDRIRLTSVLMGGGRFWHLPPAATVRDALAEAVWSNKHPVRDERLDDGTTDIDSLDAFEYTIERDYKRYLRI